MSRIPVDDLEGTLIHFLAPMLVPVSTDFFSPSLQATRGLELFIDAELIAASKDRFGSSWLDLLDDEDGQRRRWGEVAFRAGPAPQGLEPWHYGSADWAIARERARRAAWDLDTEQDRIDALRAVEARFGPAAPTSTTIAKYRA